MFNCKEFEILNDEEIKELIKKRDDNNPNETLIIENKEIESFDEVNCKNIHFKNCKFAPCYKYGFLSDSVVDNITFENCLWWDCTVTNTHFKNVKFINTIIDNNILFSDCIFENMTYKNSLMNMLGISDCVIKDTDFTNQEYFFLQCTTAEVTENLYNNNLFNNFEEYLKQNKDKLVIPWYTMTFDNCKISMESIKKLLEYSNKIDPNYFWMASAACKSGYIHLNGAEESTKYNLLCNLFLYNIEQSYDYNGKVNNSSVRNYLRNKSKYTPILYFDNMDLSKYSKVLTTEPKTLPMIIVDNNGNIIDTSLINPIGEIFFENTHDNSNSNYVDSNYYAKNLDNKIGSKAIKSK